MIKNIKNLKLPLEYGHLLKFDFIYFLLLIISNWLNVFNNFFGNVFVEVVGINITVLLIDRILKKREINETKKKDFIYDMQSYRDYLNKIHIESIVLIDLIKANDTEHSALKYYELISHSLKTLRYSSFNAEVVGGDQVSKLHEIAKKHKMMKGKILLLNPNKLDIKLISDIRDDVMRLSKKTITVEVDIAKNVFGVHHRALDSMTNLYFNAASEINNNET